MKVLTVCVLQHVKGSWVTIALDPCPLCVVFRPSELQWVATETWSAERRAQYPRIQDDVMHLPRSSSLSVGGDPQCMAQHIDEKRDELKGEIVMKQWLVVCLSTR